MFIRRSRLVRVAVFLVTSSHAHPVKITSRSRRSIFIPHPAIKTSVIPHLASIFISFRIPPNLCWTPILLQSNGHLSTTAISLQRPLFLSRQTVHTFTLILTSLYKSHLSTAATATKASQLPKLPLGDNSHLIND